jgi:aminoglycoside phosphotransferase family enzyme/predicted kinase
VRENDFRLNLCVFNCGRIALRLTYVKNVVATGELSRDVVPEPRDRMSRRRGPGLPMSATDDPVTQARLVAALADPAVFGPACERVRHLETHISHVLLTGAFAYKIKKPVDLGFLDFSALAQRKLYCEQELRLNRRLAPAIYLDVVAITGSIDRPALGGAGLVVEYAVKMREFEQDALASRMLAAGALGAAHVDALAAEVAAFHGRVETASEGTPFGSPETILRVALQNFDSIRPLRGDPGDRDRQDALRAWTEREHALRRATFERRKADGFVREGHGDLHLNNIAVIDGEVTVFDCIEFNDELRWIDVMSEIAFTTMDLADRGRPDLAHRFVNAYLENTGDYAGLAVFPFYLVYRAMVRAKIACLRVGQLEPGDERTALVAEYRGYVDLATHYARAPHPALVITHGLSGCGKTTLTQGLLEWIGAIRIRTDVERKRLHGVDARARSGSGLDEGLYAAGATERTYGRALELAEAVAAAGGVAIVDGTFLKRWQRDLFRTRAAELEFPFVILAFTASDATLRARVVERAQRATDASEADLGVLDRQLRTREPLAPDERAYVVDVDAETPQERSRDPATWRAVCARLGIEGTPPP